MTKRTIWSIDPAWIPKETKKISYKALFTTGQDPLGLGLK